MKTTYRALLQRKIQTISNKFSGIIISLQEILPELRTKDENWYKKYSKICDKVENLYAEFFEISQPIFYTGADNNKKENAIEK